MRIVDVGLFKGRVNVLKCLLRLKFAQFEKGTILGIIQLGVIII